MSDELFKPLIATQSRWRVFGCEGASGDAFVLSRCDISDMHVFLILSQEEILYSQKRLSEI